MKQIRQLNKPQPSSLGTLFQVNIPNKQIRRRPPNVSPQKTQPQQLSQSEVTNQRNQYITNPYIEDTNILKRQPNQQVTYFHDFPDTLKADSSDAIVAGQMYPCPAGLPQVDINFDNIKQNAPEQSNQESYGPDPLKNQKFGYQQLKGTRNINLIKDVNIRDNHLNFENETDSYKYKATQLQRQNQGQDRIIEQRQSQQVVARVQEKSGFNICCKTQELTDIVDDRPTISRNQMQLQSNQNTARFEHQQNQRSMNQELQQSKYGGIRNDEQFPNSRSEQQVYRSSIEPKPSQNQPIDPRSDNPLGLAQTKLNVEQQNYLNQNQESTTNRRQINQADSTAASCFCNKLSTDQEQLQISRGQNNYQKNQDQRGESNYQQNEYQRGQSNYQQNQRGQNNYQKIENQRGQNNYQQIEDQRLSESKSPERGFLEQRDGSQFQRGPNLTDLFPKTHSPFQENVQRDYTSKQNIQRNSIISSNILKAEEEEQLSYKQQNQQYLNNNPNNLQSSGLEKQEDALNSLINSNIQQVTPRMNQGAFFELPKVSYHQSIPRAAIGDEQMKDSIVKSRKNTNLIEGGADLQQTLQQLTRQNYPDQDPNQSKGVQTDLVSSQIAQSQQIVRAAIDKSSLKKSIGQQTSGIRGPLQPQIDSAVKKSIILDASYINNPESIRLSGNQIKDQQQPRNRQTSGEKEYQLYSSLKNNSGQTNRSSLLQTENEKIQREISYGQNQNQNRNSYGLVNPSQLQMASNQDRVNSKEIQLKSGAKVNQQYLGTTLAGSNLTQNASYSVFTMENGNQFIGQIQNFQVEGFGKMIFPRGGYYEGFWKQGLFHGIGTLFYRTNEIAYEGQWYEGCFHGFGTLYNDQPQNLPEIFTYDDFNSLKLGWIKYVGNFNMDRKSGRGKLFLTNGESFNGNFDEDYLTGSGVFYRGNETQVKAIWAKNVLKSLQ